MKSLLNRYVSTITIVLFSFIILFVSPEKVNGQRSITTSQVEFLPAMDVKFIAAEEGFLYFELTLNQSIDSRSQLRIRNQEGIVLYNEILFSKATTRKIKIEHENIDKLEFTYTNPKGEVKKAFQVTTRVRESIDVKNVFQP